MSVQTHSIDPPIYGRYVRIIPRGWKSHISMRLELYGGPWSKSYCSSFVKWKKKYALKVRNDTEMIFGGRGGGQSMYALFFQPLYNGHFLLSPRWPLKRRIVRINWRINFCMQLITVSSSVLVLKTDYTCNICLRFEHGLSWNHSPRKEIWIKLSRVTRPKHSLHFFFLPLLLFTFYTTYIFITY